MIGRTLKVDLHTMKEMDMSTPRVERRRFARICVEIDLQKKLIPKVFARRLCLTWNMKALRKFVLPAAGMGIGGRVVHGK